MTQGQTRKIASQASWPLHDTASTQTLERQAQTSLPEHALMQRAGLAVARLAMALAPHAHTIWIACGPGNNGGDGLEAAALLKRWGKNPVVTWIENPKIIPADAAQAAQRARAANVTFAATPPAHYELAIDALLGIGPQRRPEGLMADWINQLQHSACSVLCVDVPSGLVADTGEWLAEHAPHPSSTRHTLSLLTLKPGLFTAHGRDASGQVWFNDLGVDNSACEHTAALNMHTPESLPRAHSQHKGSRGDVSVLGGAKGMQGAAILAGMAALQGGAGRVYLGLMDQRIAMPHPALMMRTPDQLPMVDATVVCGCGGGSDIAAWLPRALSIAPRLVLDADALNAIANDAQLLTLLQRRHAKRQTTVLTPHPLEAARLLGKTVQDVQHNRLLTAHQLVELTHAIVVLKGSGTVIAAPEHTPVINHSGNARLACAGTGDVLAGLIGAKLHGATAPFEAVCQAVHTHGHAADAWPKDGPALNAASLAESLG